MRKWISCTYKTNKTPLTKYQGMLRQVRMNKAKANSTPNPI